MQKIALVGIKSNPVESEPVGEIPSAAKMVDQFDQAAMATPNTKPNWENLIIPIIMNRITRTAWQKVNLFWYLSGVGRKIIQCLL